MHDAQRRTDYDWCSHAEYYRIESYRNKKRICLFVVSCETAQTDKSVFILLLSGKTNNVVKDGLRSALPLARARSAPTILLVLLLLCWCSFCFVGAHFALLVLLLLCWCSFCFVGALETSAPPKRHQLSRILLKGVKSMISL